MKEEQAARGRRRNPPRGASAKGRWAGTGTEPLSLHLLEKTSQNTPKSCALGSFCSACAHKPNRTKKQRTLWSFAQCWMSPGEGGGGTRVPVPAPLGCSERVGTGRGTTERPTARPQNLCEYPISPSQPQNQKVPEAGTETEKSRVHNLNVGTAGIITASCKAEKRMHCMILNVMILNLMILNLMAMLLLISNNNAF